jgi:long-chain acyl-CoA synthetase
MESGEVKSMEKVWLKHYQPGVPFEINPDAYSSLNEIFENSCEQYGDQVAYINLGNSLTYNALEKKTRQFAGYLQSVLGMKKGDRVALMMPNILQYPIAMFGALRAGLIVINVNPLYTIRELEHQLVDSEAQAIVVLANFALNIEKILGKTCLKHVIITEIGDCFPFPKSFLVNWFVKYIKRMVPNWSIPNYIKFKDTLRLDKQNTFHKPEVSGEDVAYLQYTGGTTGIAKSAILTHRNMVANLEQASAWIKPFLSSGKEIIITAIPLYHIFSLTANCLIFMKIGATNILITNPRDIPSFIKELSQYQYTTITGVNTLYNALLSNPKFAELNFSSLRIALGGGMPVQQAIAEQWKKVTNSTLIEAYGLTEASPAVCISPLNLTSFNGSVGLPIPSTNISIRNEDGQELSFDQPGELWVKGPQVMKGYWNRPDETKDAIRDGWLRTGDIATVDENGFVKIVDRKKDMILVSGFNVYPTEVEDVIAMMAGVSEVAVIGVPLKESGEMVKAFIVPKNGSLTAQQIREHCRKQLTAYKVPKEIEFRSELPKSNVGKILRRALREG